MSITIGQAIRSARKRQKIKQYELAMKANISAKHLSEIEREHKYPKWETLSRILEALDASLTLHTKGKDACYTNYTATVIKLTPYND